MPLPKIEVPQYELTIPSTEKVVKYRPFLVKEEKILLIALETEDDAQIINAVQNIIDSCLYSDVDVSELSMFDVEFIFLQLRSKSKGEEVELLFECDKCKQQTPFVLNLSEVTIQRTEGHKKDISLSNGIGVKMKYPSMELRSLFSNGGSEIENIFESLVICLESIYDAETVYPAKDHTKKELDDFFESLPESEFKKIQQFFETMPSLRHDVEITCSHKTGKGKSARPCGHRNKKTLEGLQSFFG
tara:strand:- start:116 stop:850 length:735 start_codon:yes stop_codon:yes gene_type:complete